MYMQQNRQGLWYIIHVFPPGAKKLFEKNLNCIILETIFLPEQIYNVRLKLTVML